MNLEVQEYALYKMDVALTEPKRLTLADSSTGLKSYAELVLKELLTSERSRNFRFTDLEELVPSQLLKLESMSTDDWVASAHKIANKLHTVECDVQQRIQHINDVSSGGLLQLKILHDNTLKYVVVKIDESDFLDEQTLELKSGLPAKTRIQKAALATIAGNDIEELVLVDSKAKITEYWYLHFLIAQELHSSESNTVNAFNAIEHFLVTEVKKKSPADYIHIRNEIVCYFRNEDGFAFDDITEIFSKQKIENKDLKAEFPKVIEKFKKLPDNAKKKFDKQFDIKPDVIKAKIRRTIVLDTNFELRLNGEISDIRDKIVPEEDAGGKYLKIYSDSGYDTFSANNS